MTDWYLSDGHGGKAGPFATDALIAQPGFSCESWVRPVGTALKTWARPDSFPELADRLRPHDPRALADGAARRLVRREEEAESEATSAEKGPPTEAVATPVSTHETTVQKIARRYAPVYDMAGTLNGAQGFVAGVGGIVGVISLLVGLTHSEAILGGAGLAVAVLAGMWTAAVWFGMGFAAAMLRISADVAVDLAPGLSDEEKLSLHR